MNIYATFTEFLNLQETSEESLQQILQQIEIKLSELHGENLETFLVALRENNLQKLQRDQMSVKFEQGRNDFERLGEEITEIKNKLDNLREILDTQQFKYRELQLQISEMEVELAGLEREHKSLETEYNKTFKPIAKKLNDVENTLSADEFQYKSILYLLQNNYFQETAFDILAVILEKGDAMLHLEQLAQVTKIPMEEIRTIFKHMREYNVISYDENTDHYHIKHKLEME